MGHVRALQFAESPDAFQNRGAAFQEVEILGRGGVSDCFYVDREMPSAVKVRLLLL
jgi:hypothetical protein